MNIALSEEHVVRADRLGVFFYKNKAQVIKIVDSVSKLGEYLTNRQKRWKAYHIIGSSNMNKSQERVQILGMVCGKLCEEYFSRMSRFCIHGFQIWKRNVPFSWRFERFRHNYLKAGKVYIRKCICVSEMNCLKMYFFRLWIKQDYCYMSFYTYTSLF